MFLSPIRGALVYFLDCISLMKEIQSSLYIGFCSAFLFSQGNLFKCLWLMGPETLCQIFDLRNFSTFTFITCQKKFSKFWWQFSIVLLPTRAQALVILFFFEKLVFFVPVSGNEDAMTGNDAFSRDFSRKSYTQNISMKSLNSSFGQ